MFQVTAPPTSDFLTTMDPPERDITDQRQRFLEKNREAAYRCRQKKKKFINDLEERSELLKERNTQLQLQITLLKEESIFLRNLLLTHENCNCQGIQNYLQRTSRELALNLSSFLHAD